MVLMDHWSPRNQRDPKVQNTLLGHQNLRIRKDLNIQKDQNILLEHRNLRIQMHQNILISQNNLRIPLHLFPNNPMPRHHPLCQIDLNNLMLRYTLKMPLFPVTLKCLSNLMPQYH